MNIEDYREYCLSLGNDIEEKLPFQKFKNGEGVLVFYVMGHMFSFFDCNDFSVILAEMPARAHRRPEGTVRVHRQSV